MNQHRIQALRHVHFEDLGSFEVPLLEAGYDIEYVDVADGAINGLDPIAADIMVVLGGPIAAYDIEPYPVVSDMIAALKARINADRPTLGICLGAQLMAAALDARVYPGPKEIGWAALDIEDVPGSPVDTLRGLPVLHWHGDTFDLPNGCTRLASTATCRNQAFMRGPNVLGLQFHPEVLARRFENWLIGHANEIGTAGKSPVGLRDDARRYGTLLEDAGRCLMTDWISGLKP